MPGSDCRVRLRQAVVAADELEPVAGALRAKLGLGEPGLSGEGVETGGVRVRAGGVR